jgi:transcriptional regulator GlxA family with amidase domain
VSPKRIVLVLFDGVEELDAVGPYEVLAAWTRAYPGDGWEIVCASWGGGPVTCAKGLVVQAQADLAALGGADVVLQPGGWGTRPLLADARHTGWLGERHRDGALLTSVCTGSLVFAAAGLLAGRPATTHHDNLDELAGLDPSILLRPAERFVDDGDVVTSAGVSAGIDMALHLVARLAGVERARAVRHELQYDPAPPV